MGVYFGSGIGGIITTTEQIRVLNEKGPRRVSPHTIPMMISNMAGGLIAIRYGLKGPNMSIVTACATSTNAIGEAYRAFCTATPTPWWQAVQRPPLPLCP